MAPTVIKDNKPSISSEVLPKTNLNRGKISSPASTIKKNNVVKKSLEDALANIFTPTTRKRINTVPKVSTPNHKENKSVSPTSPGGVTKSIKKPLWKPVPAHSGVPTPEKMKKALQKLLQSERKL